MYHLVYTSLAANLFSEEDLVRLLEKSRTSNKEQAVSGMLLYLQGKFIQVLEGERDNVINLYERIRQDTRHRKVTTVVEGESPRRIFPNWSMGFKHLTQTEFYQESGFLEMDDFFAQQQPENKSLVLIFLELFYKKNNVDYPEVIAH
ncbi:MAG: BLUF domain-containing protein [Cyclobacteriaceae bacterium]|nr:BLUF domain-containing protein [Cyclobacteriaceae bacterium]